MLGYLSSFRYQLIFVSLRESGKTYVFYKLCSYSKIWKIYMSVEFLLIFCKIKLELKLESMS